MAAANRFPESRSTPVSLQARRGATGVLSVTGSLFKHWVGSVEVSRMLESRYRIFDLGRLVQVAIGKIVDIRLRGGGRRGFRGHAGGGHACLRIQSLDCRLRTHHLTFQRKLRGGV